MVSKQQIHNGVMNYIDNEIGRKAVGYNKFAIYFAMPTISKKVNQYLNDLSSNPLMKDMTVGEMIDVDALYQNGKNAIQKSGSFEYFGIIFNEIDIDKLYTYIKGVTV